MKKTKKLLAGLTISALAFSNILTTNFALASDNLNEVERNICKLFKIDKGSSSLKDLKIEDNHFYYMISDENYKYYKDNQEITNNEYENNYSGEGNKIYFGYGYDKNKVLFTANNLEDGEKINDNYNIIQKFGENFTYTTIKNDKIYRAFNNNTPIFKFPDNFIIGNYDIKIIGDDIKIIGNDVYYIVQTYLGDKNYNFKIFKNNKLYNEVFSNHNNSIKIEKIIGDDIYYTIDNINKKIIYKNDKKLYEFYSNIINNLNVYIDNLGNVYYTEIKDYVADSGDNFSKESDSGFYIYKNGKVLDKFENFVSYEKDMIEGVYFAYIGLYIKDNDYYLIETHIRGAGVTKIYKNGKPLCGEKTPETPVSPTNPVTEPKKETPVNGNTSVNPSNPLPSNGNSPTGKDISESIKEDNRVSKNGEINKENKKEEELTKQEKQIKESISEVVKKYDINILSAVYKIVSSEKYTQKAKTNNTVKMIIDEFKKQYLSLKK